jgi:serine/threonine-protein kinase RsbW
MLNRNSVRLDFVSEIDMLDFVNVVSDHLGRTAGLDEDALYRVGLAVRESVTNAIVHGNGNDKDKRVFIEFAPIDGDRQGIAIRVRDQGAGFDLTMPSDPLTPENLMKPHGRGVFLIRTLMDEMKLQRGAEGGMEMVMVKCVKPPMSSHDMPTAASPITFDSNKVRK